MARSGYAYEISCDGSWRFRRFRANKSAAESVEWAPSDAINTGLGATNRLGLWAYPGSFQAFANGFPVGEAEDRNLTYTLGYITLYVRPPRPSISPQRSTTSPSGTFPFSNDAIHGQAYRSKSDAPARGV